MALPPPDPSTARRRLLRGAFAAPAALALHSGSALAASSNLRCVRTQDVSPQYPQVVAGAAEPTSGPVRIPLYATFQGSSENIKAYYIAGGDIEVRRLASARVVNDFLGAAQWMQVELGNGYVTTTSTRLTSLSGQRVVGWVALRVDPDLDPAVDKVYVVGVVDAPGGPGTAVWMSCWASIVRSA